MIIGFLILSIIAIVVFTTIMVKSKAEWESPDYEWNIKSTCVLLDIIAGLICLGMIITTCCLVTGISKENVIDQKIEMYTEENTNIEESIDDLVREYMDYEGKTLSNFKTESSITLINLYPELKSDELVQQQLSIYVDNNNKIKELKEQKIDIQTKKFVLYFG